jgi:molybdopterin biosynthesis enzyme
MLSVEDALAVVLREAKPLPSEDVALDEALGRVLAEDVAADRDLPPFDRSAMDGYALRAADVAQAPCALELVGEVRAGDWPTLSVGPGQAAKIMTGAPLPPGATAVQQVEKTRPLDQFRVTVERSRAFLAASARTVRASGVRLALNSSK